MAFFEGGWICFVVTVGGLVSDAIVGIMYKNIQDAQEKSALCRREEGVCGRQCWRRIDFTRCGSVGRGGGAECRRR
jgi:hypothetical protein